MKNNLKNMMICLADAHVRFVVAGGVAVVLHGVERVTMDLDLALAMDRNNILSFLSVMKEFSMQPYVPVPPEILIDPEQRKKIVREKHAVVFSFRSTEIPLWSVDVFLAKELTYDKLSKKNLTVEIEGRKIRIVSLDKLIETKKNIHPRRPKDVMDLEELYKIRNAKK